jgi:hypothetical protein
MSLSQLKSKGTKIFDWLRILKCEIDCTRKILKAMKILEYNLIFRKILEISKFGNPLLANFKIRSKNFGHQFFWVTKTNSKLGIKSVKIEFGFCFCAP